MTWRYFATRLNGDGTEDLVIPDLPLTGVSITDSVNAPPEIDAQLSPEYAMLTDENGDSLIRKWSSAIYAEEDDVLAGGGILVDDSIDPESATLQLSGMGFSGYPNGQPYTEADTWPPNPYPTGGIEPMDAFREVWRHLQAQTMGNLGVEIDPSNTGKLIGKMVAQGTFDTENGPLSFEYEPFLLRWFETHDLGDVMQTIATNTPLDFREELSYRDDGTIRKFIRIGYPRIGSRRHDYTFIMGQNVALSSIDAPDDEYASTILGLGAGEGSAMKRAMVYRSDETRIRRATVFESKASRTSAAINLAAQAELRARLALDEVTEITAMPDHVEDLLAVQPGDEVRLVGDTPFREVDMWVRVMSRTRTPESGTLEFTVVRSDMLA